ncbi:peroxiredoxin-like family protein [Pseudomonas sp. efr-133-TYG-103a]|uniref:peroxiredoxin-like family protein n=1 Tax=Pseudomonas sp. efr-133-TYG-103a TaxID=3040308 RepID=UPI0025530F54|nr:peroxiredoxin-like family protein [Pseudomonas sp. efr-133-TYG-103a]
MSLQLKLDAVKHDFESKVPAQALAVMEKSTQDLVSSKQAERALKSGDNAPAFTLADSDGNTVTSKDLLLKGPLVITFYRGVWCPYCNLELQALEALRSEIESRGATLVAISQQTAGNSRASRRDNAVSFPILIDQGGMLADAFGIRWALQGEIKALYEQFGVNLQTFNGESSWTLPMPARYVIDTQGVIAYSEINPDYTQRPEPVELLPVLDALANKTVAGKTLAGAL